MVSISLKSSLQKEKRKNLSSAIRAGSLMFSFLLVFFFHSCRQSAEGGFKTDVSASELESRFLNPPPEARPWVFWFWMNGNITKEGITADLEAMNRIGVGGAIFMGVGLATPVGDIAFDSPEWHELFSHACKESLRLGMQLVLHQCDGWAMAGGQWIKPEQSIKMLVWSDQEIEGPRQGPFRIDQPHTRVRYYKDVALLAIPLESRRQQSPMMITVDGKPAPGLHDGDLIKGETIGKTIQIAFGQPTPVASLVMHMMPFVPEFASFFPGTVEVSDNGEAFDTVTSFDLNVTESLRDKKTFTVSFPTRKAKFVRIFFEKQRNKEIGEIEILDEPRVHLWEAKTGFAMKREHGGETFMIDQNPFPAEIAGVDPNSVVDLTEKIDANGGFDWTVPAGRWKVIRIGMTSSGREVGPKTTAGGGLEADKMNRETVRFHFDSFAKRVIEQNNISKGNPIMGIHTDSWESGPHTWSSEFQKEFERRCGYSITPWLPVVTLGLIVGNAQESERFLWDLRRTTADLLTENFFGEMQHCAHENGVIYQAEASGRQMFMYDPLNYQSRNDLPIGEFWKGDFEPTTELRVDCRVASSVAHTYNRPFVGAEAFTSNDGDHRHAPADFKVLGDMAFCTGINRFYIHRYCGQPWDVAPGMMFSRYGINFDRTQTWWENGGKAWCDYLRSCQAILQSGSFVADVIHFIGEDAPNFLGHRNDIWNPIPPGYDYDGCNLEILKRLKVNTDGRLVLPHGMSYRVLLLPSREHITLDALQTIEKLVRNGATVVGPRPVRTPGFKNYRQNDETLRSLAEKMWGKIDGKNVMENVYGKGRVIYGPSMEEILTSILPPDFDYVCADGEKPLNYIHRKTKDTDFYFVANSNESKVVETFARFRVTGKSPEFWDASTRTIVQPAIYREKDGIIEVPLRLDPAGSVFVVFREPANPQAIVSVSCGSEQLFPPDAEQPIFPPVLYFAADSDLHIDGGDPAQYELSSAKGKTSSLTIPKPDQGVVLQGPWTVSFPPEKQAPEYISLPELMSWTESEDDGVKYFSGTATYTTTFEWSKPHSEKEAILLDLGEVKNIAEVKLNGVDLGVLWKMPYVADVTQAIKNGINELEIQVTNLWINRLIGDEKLHPDTSLIYDPRRPIIRTFPEWVKTGGNSPVGRTTFVTYRYYDENSPLLPSGLLGTVEVHSKFIK